MENTTTSPALREFCVFADRDTRMYQNVTATTPEEAIRLAGDDKDAWECCFEHGGSDYLISNDVLEIATGEFIAVGGAVHCKTCGSEIVETINDSLFREGECGGCECKRYRSQRALLDACKGMCGMIYRDKNDDEQIDFGDYEKAERDCRSAIANAECGSAA